MSDRQPRGSRRNGRKIVFWSLFAAGLLVQLFAPHLKISNQAFVIPEQALSNAEEIIRKERLLQLLSAVLTASGALGLAFLYREILFGKSSRDAAGQPGYLGDPLSGDRRYCASTADESPKKEKEVST
jgi:hypothetical protein